MARRLALLICLLGGAAVAGLALPAAPAAAAPSRADAQFLRAAHELNLAQIDGARQAQRRGASRQVRDLGTRFANDHDRLDRALRQAAGILRVVLPTAPDQEQRTMLAGYAAAPVEQFDALFLATQLDVHTAAIRAATGQVATGTDARAVKVARDLLAALRTQYDALNAVALELDLPSQHSIEPAGPPTVGPVLMSVLVLLAMGLIASAGRAYRAVPERPRHRAELSTPRSRSAG
ncbi:DUF4142 domain-containing protein [Rhizomonospora bruguierae]|uniref:DUF4142 domain-containing protein n=1 Tax=Rhizomonospora bruguierae TaxID=1581705 RepID=UPI001BCCDED6|nr:DUF4142 domain-containing protein [Micromonospora sp. NBRC 107566]